MAVNHDAPGPMALLRGAGGPAARWAFTAALVVLASLLFAVIRFL